MTNKRCAEVLQSIKFMLENHNYSDEVEEALDLAIKALEQEPCEDCISREAVMKCFKKWQPYMATRLWDYEQELKDLPSVTPQQARWIPVSEKLPDECMNCLITVKTDAYFCNPHYENYIAWFDGKDFVYEYENKSIVAKISIIAWQPLPQPYKESEDKE